MNATPPSPGSPPARRIRFSVGRTRTGGWWVALVAAASALLLLLIFVLQNGTSVQVSFLGMHGDLPLGVALLLAATAGVLIVAIPGSGRIIQLRRLLQRAQLDRPTPGPPVDLPETDPVHRPMGTRPSGQPETTPSEGEPILPGPKNLDQQDQAAD